MSFKRPLTINDIYNKYKQYTQSEVKYNNKGLLPDPYWPRDPHTAAMDYLIKDLSVPYQPPDHNAQQLAEVGVKYDKDKLRFELLPPEFLKAVVTILTFGAKKYTSRNWEKGMDWSRVYGALQRHLNAWWGGESKDPETGESHLWHAACCICFLVVYEIRGVGNDDRVR